MSIISWTHLYEAKLEWNEGCGNVTEQPQHQSKDIHKRTTPVSVSVGGTLKRSGTGSPLISGLWRRSGDSETGGRSALLHHRLNENERGNEAESRNYSCSLLPLRT